MWYPLAFALLAALACSFDFDIVLIYFIMISTVFAALFGRDFKPILVTILFTYFSLGLHGDVTKMNIMQYQMGFSTSDLVQLIVCVAVLLAAIVFRLASDGSLKRGLKRHMFTASILAMCTAFALNGVFYSEYSINSLIMGVIEIAGFLPIYYIVLCGLGSDKSVIPYVCKLCAICAGMVMLEVAILMLKLNSVELLVIDGAIRRDFMVLGWGVNNLIGAVLSMCIVPIMYLAYSQKKLGFLMTIWAAVILVMLFIIQCRSALLSGAIMFLICLFICCIKGNNRFANRIIAIVVACCGVVFIILALTGIISDILPHIFVNIEGIDSGRFDMWEMSWDYFTKNPVFGVGFGESAYPPGHPSYGTSMLLQNMYHNIGVQFFATMGVLGVLAFGFHLFELGWNFIRSRDAGTIFMGLAAAAIILMSLFDNFFFYPCISIFYVVFLAVAELGQDKKEPDQAGAAVTATENERV